MGNVTRQYEYAAGETINPDENNANENALYTLVNGNLDNDNVKASAAISESKIAFSASGHGHTGGSDGKLIPSTAVWTITGTLTTSTDAAPWIRFKNARTITSASAIAKTAPTGADVIIDIEMSADDGDTWTSIWNTTPANRLTISATNREGTQTSFDTTAVAAGNYLRIAVDQIGSTLPGQDITVQVAL
jgi:hypothetical protein